MRGRSLLAAVMCGALAQAAPQPAFDLGRQLRGSDSVRAFALIEQAARSGHVPAMFILSSMLASGEGRAKDAASARAWLEKAVEEEHPEAMQQLAMHLQDGSGGYARDEQRAALLLRKMAHALKHRQHEGAGSHRH